MFTPDTLPTQMILPAHPTPLFHRDNVGLIGGRSCGSLLGTVGEPINPEAWKWFHKEIGHGHCPIMDTWWQTETGGFTITPLPTTPLKPGSATKAFFGQKIAVEVLRGGKPETVNVTVGERK